MSQNEASIAPVLVEHIDGIARLTVTNPPVNALSRAVRQALLDLIDEFSTRPDVRAVVIAGAGQAFIAGADMREFDGPLLEPALPEVLLAIEGSQKPIVAAIDGVALGGGAELALACHACLATERSSFGFPEVKLGIIPGAAGIPRLVRLVDPTKALDLVSNGRPVNAREACSLGVFDAVVEVSRLMDAAVALANVLAGGVLRRTSQLPVRATEDPVAFEVSAQRLLGRARGQRSVREAVNAVRAALDQDFRQAAASNRATFLDLRMSEQARALRHLFFAEREAQRVPGVDTKASRTVASVAVVGAGTMGRGIASACLKAGYPTLLIDQDTAIVDRAKAAIGESLARMAKSEKWEAARAQTLLDRLEVAISLAAVARRDLIIEAVFEDLTVKQEVLVGIALHADTGAIIATNTSYLDTNLLGSSVADPSRFVGLHFFAPAEVMRLVEVVRTKDSDPAVIATALRFAKSLDKLAVVSGVCDGFIVNRILARYRREMEYLLEDGALPEEIDGALEAFGFAMGPFAVADLSGLDISWARRKRLAPTRDPSERYVKVADWLCEMGRFGRKAGAGWYCYGEGKRVPDPVVEELVKRASAERDITRHPISSNAIVERALEAMVSEAKTILNEGVALRSSDIDLAIVHGLGFPAWRGGPLFNSANTGNGST
ncbi:3-hydroxyacyl-CoA dehydrogenase [Mesorhizobium sp. B3-1-3]|uniref:3-hydroxyacyl-CoA dehydrogenase NAD-binding domain-containing protein n=1 Tax=unclassified Mesorhizobium TaxID=325217 RepID=UPI00112C2ABE|nr:MULTISPECIES: 3-hydroxyacyl-CoA dehydrogenase NAD-binding domain-containing protein [unclassified Mesorhizobium]TPI57366.1 3-hydroxyacyl-CoA dehydrogenase [Mesorhizobium sp. B3-1-8]TPI63519.1 3-hydroxyacyl-CoA dehydrogenase [Mesorhizobium sp. B3-1-3]